MKSVSLSVIVPAYNSAKTIQDTISSVRRQSSDVEIIVVDDGSTDETGRAAREFGPEVRVISTTNQGVSAARNIGLRESQGEWAVFVDADDILASGTVEKRLVATLDTDADVVICDWIDFVDRPPAVTAHGDIHRVDWAALAADAELATATSVWATTAAIMYRRSLIERIGGFRADLPVIQDARFLFDAARQGARIVHSQHVGAFYRVAPLSLSRRDPGRFWIDVLNNGRQIEALWRSDSKLTPSRRQGLLGVYNNAARGLFTAWRPEFFDALAAQEALGLGRPLHGRLAAPLARVIGLAPAQRLLSFVGRG